MEGKRAESSTPKSSKTIGNKYQVLISCPLIHDDIDDYTETFEAHDIVADVPEVDQQLNEDELLDIIDQYDGVIAGDDQFTSAVLNRAKQLQVISKWGIGTDGIDSEAAAELGIKVYNTPGVFDDEVADVVIGYTIMLTRKLHQIDQAVSHGEWFCPRGTSLSGKTLGIVGVGSIGSTVARRAVALGMDVIGNDVRSFSDELVADTGIESVDKDQLFQQSDIVSLNCPLTPETQGLVDEEALEALGPKGYLINTARGKLVDQNALVEALAAEQIAGAALDVFEKEPLPPESPLTDFDNTILGSHNAQNTTEALKRTHERAIENLIDGLQ